MTVHHSKLPEHDHPFIGTWHIYAMEFWSADYFNMEVQAYVELRADLVGAFQFGLVSGAIRGDLEGAPDRQRFVFTWEGNDEMDPASGRGWLRLKGKNELLGLIALHHGDRSRFKARRARRAGEPDQTR